MNEPLRHLAVENIGENARLFEWEDFEEISRGEEGFYLWMLFLKKSLWDNYQIHIQLDVGMELRAYKGWDPVFHCSVQKFCKAESYEETTFIKDVAYKMAFKTPEEALEWGLIEALEEI